MRPTKSQYLKQLESSLKSKTIHIWAKHRHIQNHNSWRPLIQQMWSSIPHKLHTLSFIDQIARLQRRLLFQRTRAVFWASMLETAWAWPRKSHWLRLRHLLKHHKHFTSTWQHRLWRAQLCVNTFSWLYSMNCTRKTTTSRGEIACRRRQTSEFAEKSFVENRVLPYVWNARGWRLNRGFWQAVPRSNPRTGFFTHRNEELRKAYIFLTMRRQNS